MENVGSRRVVACSCQSIEPVILIWESWWRQANRRGPKPWFLYSSSSILEPTRMYIWIRLNCQEPHAGCPLKPQDASRSRADKIRSTRSYGNPVEPSVTFRNSRSHDLHRNASSMRSPAIILGYSLIIQVDILFLLHISLTMTLVQMYSSFSWVSTTISCWQCAFDYRILRIPGDEYISSCLWPLRKKYSIAVKSFLPTKIFFWNSALQPLLALVSSDCDNSRDSWIVKSLETHLAYALKLSCASCSDRRISKIFLSIGLGFGSSELTIGFFRISRRHFR